VPVPRIMSGIGKRYLLKSERCIAERNHVLCTALMRRLGTVLRREPMSGTCDRAKRYCNRANECLQVFAISQTPGTGEIYLVIAEHYLLLAASEKEKELGRTEAASHHEVP
jgi:hypothetical protein